MPKTTKLGIEITTDNETKFLDWREFINGDSPDSMANIIDDFAINITNLINSISGGGGDGIDLDEIGYMNYAADIFYRGGHQSLFSDAWTNHNKPRTTLFDGNISFEATDDSMGIPLSFYSGDGVDEFYDFLANGGVRPGEALKITVDDTVVELSFFSQFPMFMVGDEVGPFLMVINGTDLGMPYGKAIAFVGNENVNYLKIESGFNHYYKNGIIIPDGVEIVPSGSYNGNTRVEVIDEYFTNNDFPLVIPNSVTSIGNSAFDNWRSNNQPLVIPDSVTSIGDVAFCDWTSNNQPLVIPNSVTSIGSEAFRDWTSNNQPLVIPESITSIGDSAFSGWQSVPYVEIQRTTPPTLAVSDAFSNQNNAPIYVPDESVDAYKTATNWVNLADRIFPMSDMASDSSASGGGDGIDLDEIGYLNHASKIFYGSNKQNQFKNAWQDMKKVDGTEIERDSTTSTQYGTLQYPNGEDNGVIIPDSVTSIGEWAFNNWPANNQPLVIPNSVTSIGNYAFAYWSVNDQPLVIPNSVTIIGNYAFWDWSSNNQPLVIPDSVTSIGSSAFRNWTANNQPLVIPDSVTSIGNDAFQNWTVNNQPLVIPNSITSIGYGAFRDWTSNNQPLVIPNSVTSIGNYAFSKWSSNNQPLVIPNSVTIIGALAFGNWGNVPYIEMKSETPPTLAGSNAFNNQNDAPIYVPDGSVDDYKTATNWVNLASRIFPISDK